MPKRTCLAIILAAGEGTRMRSATPKVLHPVGGLPMLGHVLRTAKAVGASRIAVVARVGASGDAVAAFVKAQSPDAVVYRQNPSDPADSGTGKAVLAARKEFGRGYSDILVLYGDTPLVTGETLAAMRERLARKTDVVVMGFRPADPTGYGRLITNGRQLLAIREEKDAAPGERGIGFCNAGVMAFQGEGVPALLKKIGNANAKGEYYLTDLVEIANRAGKSVEAVEADAREVAGVNTRLELSAVEGTFQERARRAAMANGVTMLAPKTVFFSYDTRLGEDVVIEPNVFFGPGVSVEGGVTIRAFSHIEGATVARGAVIGPFARLRPGSEIGANARIGNFVETKAAVIDKGAKVNHLTYIGDAHIGAETNIGAGTITCNYDGYGKYRTEIGANAFIGSNSALVAPVTIGKGAYVASGSVITMNVPPDALAVARGRQAVKKGWAEAFRRRKGGGKGKH
ncbi:MAG TPA: bifunctional UDP-N-acetylglucosamine diphosphorylase/glucosamine-1-phosphate N-acetyltransferase GlmU [Bauldia sp.]|nr:bifunctional UDP-N-acetylglucosamine diphosphorylase/glucosamine-1-phosphate N-acetyltransferase GlmU [Bauldia sp.]